MEDFVIGIDLGGTNLRMAAVNLQGAILHRIHHPVESHRGRDAVLNDIISSAETLAKQVISQADRFLAVGLGLPGLICPLEGIVTQSPNLPGWVDFDVRTPVENTLGVPLVIENDANSFALGEFWQGAARGIRHFCALTLGTGVGGGIVLNGELWSGADGMAGEVGHMIIESEGHPCTCGSRGCLEQYASGTAIRRLALEAVTDHEKTLLSTGPEGLTALDVFEAAKQGDHAALKIFQTMGYFLGIGLTNLVNFLNIDMIVLGGKVSNAWEFFAPKAEQTLRERAFKVPARRVRIVKSELGDDGGLVGAAYLAFRKVGQIG